MMLSKASEVYHKLIRCNCKKERDCKSDIKMQSFVNSAVIARVLYHFYDFRNQHQFTSHRKSMARCEICLNVITKTP